LHGVGVGMTAVGVAMIAEEPTTTGCHPSESWDPAHRDRDVEAWAPAFAGVTRGGWVRVGIEQRLVGTGPRPSPGREEGVEVIAANRTPFYISPWVARKR